MIEAAIHICELGHNRECGMLLGRAPATSTPTQRFGPYLAGFRASELLRNDLILPGNIHSLGVIEFRCS
jgi:hypothetical protein